MARAEYVVDLRVVGAEAIDRVIELHAAAEARARRWRLIAFAGWALAAALVIAAWMWAL